MDAAAFIFIVMSPLSTIVISAQSAPSPCSHPVSVRLSSSSIRRETSTARREDREDVDLHSSENQWIIARKDIYKVFVYPDDWKRFFELIGTTLSRKVHLMRVSQKILLKYSRRYGRTRLDEIRRRYECGEDWTDVILPLLKGVGKRMRKRRNSLILFP